MCDTLVATTLATERGGALFAKNSDRERNEAQVLEFVAARPGCAGRRLRLTYIDVDDPQPTHACVISRPFWMWGAEMGANVHGVVIGNEAMHALVPAERKRALTGMDLVRLALERAVTAADAVEVMTKLLEWHGQGGDCGHRNRFYYQNGFMIADARSAFVLETVGRDWAVQRVEGVRALSNAYSIDKPDRLSAGLRARAAAGVADAGDVSLADCLIDPARDFATFGRGRYARAGELLAHKYGRIDVADLAAVLRDHGAESDHETPWSPRRTARRTICMHAAEGGRRSQSVASMMSDLTGARAVHWVTATSAPCLSLFKPIVIGVPLPAHGPPPSDRCDEESLWWTHERLHRSALHDFPTALDLIAAERDDVEAGFRARVSDALEGDEERLAEVIRRCWSQAAEVEDRWRQAIRARRRPRSSGMGRAAAVSWSRLNASAGFPPDAGRASTGRTAWSGDAIAPHCGRTRRSY